MRYFNYFVIILQFFTCIHLQAQTWRELGPCGSGTYGNTVAEQGGTGQIHCIRFDPDDPQLVYCGSPYGGLWKSTDGGKSWSANEIDVRQSLELSSVCDIAIARSSGTKTIWVATGHPGGRGGTDLYTTGIYFSTDNGKTFQPLKAFNDKCHFAFRYKKHISRIIIHPTNAQIMLLATSDGVYRTTDGGENWYLVLTEEELPGTYEFSNGIFNVEFSKTDPDHIIYASGKDVYRSVKGGKKGSFKTMSHLGLDFFSDGFDCLQNLNFNINVNFDSARTDVLYAYAFVKGDTCGQFKKRSSLALFYFNGKAWQSLNAVPNSSYIDPIRLRISSIPGVPAIVYLGSAVTSVSSNYGKTWKQATDYNRPGHADIHAIEIIPGTRDMITGTDGGVFRYNYETGKVEEYNNGLCITMVTAMGASASNPKKILIGNQDTGSDMWDGTNWTKLPTGGDGYPPQVINWKKENDFFTCANGRFLENTTDNGIGLNNSSNCMPRGNNCPYSFLQSPMQPDVFYYGERELYRSIDNCRTWCRISDFRKRPDLYINPGGHIIISLAVAPSDSNIIYAAYNAFSTSCDSYLLKTKKGGMVCGGQCADPKGEDNWTYLNTTPRIETGSNQGDFIANSDFYISGIAVSDKNPDKVWISYCSWKLNPIDFKLYKTINGGNSWQADEKGLPDFPCTGIVYINGSDDDLFVSTYNGVYFKHGSGSWTRFGTGLPNVYVTAMQINYNTHKLRVSTYGRGVWEVDLP